MDGSHSIFIHYVHIESIVIGKQWFPISGAMDHREEPPFAHAYMWFRDVFQRWVYGFVDLGWMNVSTCIRIGVVYTDLCSFEASKHCSDCELCVP